MVRPSTDSGRTLHFDCAQCPSTKCPELVEGSVVECVRRMVHFDCAQCPSTKCPGLVEGSVVECVRGMASISNHLRLTAHIWNYELRETHNANRTLKTATIDFRLKIKYMFTNRAFNVAFLFSLAWHLFCMSVFNIVVLPGKYKTRELSSVSFLGPLLEKTALEIMLVNKPVAVDTRYRRDLKYTHTFGEEDIPFAREKSGDETKNYIRTHLEKTMDAVPGILFGGDKERPQTANVKTIQNASIKDSGSISGSVAGREIIYKPAVPKLPRWLAASAPFTLELEFSVSVQGEIKKVTPVVSSGNSEVDLLGTRYLKAWKFAPLSPGLHEEEIGRIRLVFGAK